MLKYLKALVAMAVKTRLRLKRKDKANLIMVDKSSIVFFCRLVGKLQYSFLVTDLLPNSEGKRKTNSSK